MGLRAYLLALGLAALLNATQATFGHSARWCAWCADDPATLLGTNGRRAP
jgi:hypothetical protein